MAKIMTIRPPDTLKNIISQSAKDKGYTTNQLVLQILWEWVDRNKPA